jgi:adenine-specific DNA-methyltransferase
MEKLKMHTPDFTDENIARLAELFPNCVTETTDDKGNLNRAIDFDQLRQELSGSIVEGPQERYHLDWPGKREALLTANAPIAKTLRPSRDESVDFDTTKNLYIEGDNLDALKLLQETYLGKVKMIYIDPPYNTGSDFIYDDDFAEDKDAYFERSMQLDEEGNRLIANTETNGRFHSDWLSMMYARLKLARNLLRDDGFVVVSIDDAELENMKHLLNEIFGNDNEIASLVWDRNRKNDAKFFSVGHEYMCVYSKSKQLLRDNKIILREPKPGFEEAKIFFANLRVNYKDSWESIQREWRDFYNALPPSDERKKLGRFSKVGPRGPFRDDGNINWPGGGGPRYEVLHPVTGKPCKVPTSGWRFPQKERLWEEFDNGKVVFGADETTVPRIISYLFESDGQVMQSVFYSYAQTASVEFEELMGAKVFDNPKNWRDLRRLTSYLTAADDTIVDFFSGSSSSAHAVISTNADDGGDRKFIMVQLQEVVPEETDAFEAGYKTITEIGKERIRRAGKKIKAEAGLMGANLDIGFRVLKIDTSNMKDVYYSPDTAEQANLLDQIGNVKEDRTSEDLLFQVMLDWGVDLALPIERENIENKEVFFVDGNVFAACFDDGISGELVKAIADRKPMRAVFKDNGYDRDDTKINLAEIFKLASPNTELKAI